ncbi:DUF362 domain-containing protein [bacterium]|nr:DUF362 domain-containing protein [bacterium]
MTDAERENGRTVVSITRSESYEPAAVRAAVTAAVNAVGGMSRYVSPGQSVLIKPNLLAAKSPDRAITTHPVVIEVIIELVRGAGGEPVIGDSPGGALRGIDRVWTNTGMQELSERTGVPLVGFEAAGSVKLTGELKDYMIARPVVDADVIINVPKLKTHVLTLYTGCIKNMFGAIPGFAKGRVHNLAGRPAPFSRYLVGVHSLVRPALNIMDGIVAMEGDGPSGGKPRYVGAVFAGSDAVAIDTIAAAMIGMDAGRIHMIRLASERGLGVSDPDRIDVVGETPESFDTAGFVLPSATVLNYIPDFLLRALKPFIWVHPEMSREWGCVAEKCGLCVRSCPVGAITMTENGHG